MTSVDCYQYNVLVSQWIDITISNINCINSIIVVSLSHNPQYTTPVSQPFSSLHGA